MSGPEHISVVIPNWNGAHWLKACLDSLRAQTFRDFHVYVVDNGSTDDSVALMQVSYPEVTILRNETNLGFAGGINRGFVAARGALIVALNNDVEVDPDWLAVMARTMDQHPKAGSGASQLMDFKDRDLIDSLGDGFLPIGLSFKVASGLRYPATHFPVRAIQSPCAAASVYRREMLEEIGSFDEDFFAYMEDIDLGLRAQSAGYDCITIPGAKVYHIGSATSGGTASAFSIRLTVRNTYQVILKNVPLPLMFLYLGLTLSVHLLLLVASVLPIGPIWLRKHRKSLVQGLSAAAREAPNSLKKRRKFSGKRVETTWDFLLVTWRTWRLRASLFSENPRESE